MIYRALAAGLLLSSLWLTGCCCSRGCGPDFGCGRSYWGAYADNPPGCDPCDTCGNWARLRPVAEVRIVERHDRGQTRAKALCCPDIPGGIVSQTAEEFDAAGKLVRRTNIELVDFETK